MWRLSAALSESVPRVGVTMLRLCSLSLLLSSFRCSSLTPWTQEKLSHRAITLSQEEVRTALASTDVDQMWQRDLRPLLVVRYPGSPGNQAVQEHIKSVLGSLSAGWEVTEDSFMSETPYGPLPFTNLVATLRPDARRHLVLACHFDSKYYPSVWHGQQFLGATDSAVPCAMMLEAARSLDQHLKTHKESNPSLSLQLIFFDGEEALQQWSSTDSLYGSRHLAQKMQATPHPAGATNTNQLDAMDLFVLLDLIGASSPRFGNQFPNTVPWLSRLQRIEQRLHSMNLLLNHPETVEYFWPDRRVANVLDDHIPFLNRGVRILHLIPYPFPSVWHSLEDNEQNLDRSTISNLNKILQLFILEYLNIRPPVSTETQNIL